MRSSARHTGFFVGLSYATGTYFGPKAEYDGLGFEAKLAQNAVVKTTVFDNWLGSVGNWAQTEALQLIGGIVSHRLPYGIPNREVDP